MNTKFTQGEWSVLGEIVIAEGGHKTIKPLCSLNGRMDPNEDGANAHLIAAAPDMYAFIQSLLDYGMLNNTDEEEAQILLTKARGGI